MLNRFKLGLFRHWCRFVLRKENYEDHPYVIKRRFKISFLKRPRFFLYKKLKNPKKILFIHKGKKEDEFLGYILARALILRGHKINIFSCGGILFCCRAKQKNVKNKNLCESCISYSKKLFDAYKLQYNFFSEYLNSQDFIFSENIASNLSKRKLINYLYDGINVGFFSFRYIESLYRSWLFFDELDEEKEILFRLAIKSYILLVVAMRRFLSKSKIDIIFGQGEIGIFNIIREVALKFNIDCVGFSLAYSHYFASKVNGIVFTRSLFFHFTERDINWNKFKKKKLMDEEIDFLYKFVLKFRKNSYLYKNTNSLKKNFELIKKELSLKNCPIISLFPNVPWDCVYSHDVFSNKSSFNNVFSWLNSVVKYSKNRSDLQFVIRFHPGEVFDKNFFGYKRVKDSFCKKIKYLPKNVKLIGASDDICSYTLGLNSDVIMVYNGSLGYEFSLLGKKPWVFARCDYSHKGFTLDVESEKQMIDLLNKSCFDNNLNQEQIELARKVFYWTRIRRFFPLFFLKNDKIYPNDFNFLVPEKNEIIDQVCDSILNKKEFFVNFAEMKKFTEV